MKLYQSIGQRKSCREYDAQPLSQAQLDEIAEAIKGFQPLSPAAPLTWRVTNQVKGLYHVQAPHYLIISGQGREQEKEHAGFLFEQLVLWLDAKGLGSVWLGASKDAQGADTKQDIIAIAFGKPTEAIHRAATEFKRKPIEQITNAPEDPCIQAAHLAPSGMNTQPWYFEKQGDKILLYCQKFKPPISLVYKLSDVDMGIALCHYALACQEEGRPFRFSRETALAEKSGYLPFGTLA